MRTQLYILMWELKIIWELIKIKWAIVLNSPLISHELYQRQERVRRLSYSVQLLSDLGDHFSDLTTFTEVQNITHYQESVLNEFHPEFVKALKRKCPKTKESLWAFCSKKTLSTI